MKGFKISITKNGKHVNIVPENLNIDEFITLAANSLQLALSAAYNQLESRYPKEEDKTALRAALYDRLIILTTEISQGIYPEYVDLYEKTPEAFLEHLENKIKELKEHEHNKNSTDSEEQTEAVRQE